MSIGVSSGWSKFSDYLEYYPRKGEPGYDGIHTGIKGIKEDAPEEAQKAYYEYQRMCDRAKQNGIRL